MHTGEHLPSLQGFCIFFHEYRVAGFQFVLVNLQSGM